MAVHHGGKVGRAGKTLASNSSSKSAKSKAGKTLANHKAKSHQYGLLIRPEQVEKLFFLIKISILI